MQQPHIACHKTLADACALLLTSGADSLLVDRPQDTPLCLNLAQVRKLLAAHNGLLHQPLHQLQLGELRAGTEQTALSLQLTPSTLLELLQALVEQSEDAIYIKDRDGRYLFANQRYADAIGQPLNGLIGRHDRDVCTPAQAGRHARLEKSVLASDQPQSHEEPLSNAAGVALYRITRGRLHVRGQVLGSYGIARSLDELRQAQAQRDQSESELELIFQSLPDLFFRISADGTILDYRAHNQNELYLPPEQFLGKRMQDVLPSHLGDLLSRKIAEQQAAGGLIRYEYDLAVPEGHQHFEARLRDLPGTDEFFVLVRDITQQHREQQALRRLEQQLQQALEAAREGVWDWDLQAHQITANRQFYTMLGDSPSELPLPLDQWRARLHPDDLPRYDALFAELLRDSRAWLELEFRVRNPQGDYQWLRTKAQVAQRSAQGRAERVVGTHEEVSQRKALELQLKLAATVFENTGEGVLIADPAGYILEANSGFEEITGYPRAQLIGRHCRLLNPRRQAPGFYRALWTELKQHKRWRGEFWSRCADGRLLPSLLNINLVLDDNRQISHFVAVFSDISLIKRAEARLDHLAHHDSLTGLPNRLMLQARLGRALVHAGRNSEKLALLFLDLDRFKQVNDSQGHEAGDQLLKQVASRLLDCVRTEDTVARLGGDEFVVLLENLRELQDANQVAEKILARMRRPFELGDERFYSSASVGISVFPDDGKSPSELMRAADAAMYLVKQSGRDGASFFSSQLTAAARQRAASQSELHHAIGNHQLRLHYQPQCNLATGAPVSREALLRWQHPERGLLLPHHFLPRPRDNPLADRLTEWVIAEACRQQRRWLDRGEPALPLSVNLGLEGRPEFLLPLLERELATQSLPANLLRVEITEALLHDQAADCQTLLTGLAARGIGTVLDDFGTGFSSLAQLKDLPLRQLKIHDSFIRALPHSQADARLVTGIISLGHSLGIEVLAEGVETEAQRQFLQQQGCSLGQGYLLGRPLPA